MALAVVEHIEHPFARGDLTSDGVQWSPEKITTTDDYEAVEEVTINPPSLGAVVEFEFGLTCALRSSGTTESVLFIWQARNKGGTWVDLHAAVTCPADASADRQYTYSGRFPAVTNFNTVPFDLRLVIKSGGSGGENAVGKTKNSSYVRVVYATA